MSKTFPLQVGDHISGLELQIAEASLRLEEVVVTAKEGGGLNSSSRIEKQALDHVQPSSLRDIMQLIGKPHGKSRFKPGEPIDYKRYWV